MFQHSRDEVANAVSTALVQIKFLWIQVYSVLSNTEVFDAELSMQLTEAMNNFNSIGSEMLKDLLRKSGWTDEQINNGVEEAKKMLWDE